MKRFLSKKSQTIPPFYVMDILAKAQAYESQGRAIYHLEVGEPDFPTPQTINAQAKSALDAGLTRYTPAIGLPSLREKISAFYQARFQLEVPSERIIVTTGASGGLLLVLAALLDPDDLVAVTDPGYPCNANFVKVFNGQVHPITLSVDNGFEVDVETLRQQWDTRIKVLMLASPSNPTGRVISPAQLKQIAEFVKSQSTLLIVDEIYQGLIYDEMSVNTALAVDNDCVVINSFSKYFCMTGWRLGWVVVPEAFVEPIDKIAQNILLAPPTISQHAALAAFDPDTIDELERNRVAFKQRRDFLFNAVTDLGFQIHKKPEGAFYLYADSSKLHNESDEFVKLLLDQTGVAITPGKDFGVQRAQDYVRFAYTQSIDKLEQAVAALAKVI